MAEQTTCHEEVTDTEGIILGACAEPATARRLDPDAGNAYPVCPQHAVGPLRVQQRRAKGWRKPAGAVAVGRGTRWGNPFAVRGRDADGWHAEDWDPEFGRYVVTMLTHADARTVVVQAYRRVVLGGTGLFNTPTPDEIRTALAGKTLMCWCPVTGRCHGDVLLELANRVDRS